MKALNSVPQPADSQRSSDFHAAGLLPIECAVKEIRLLIFCVIKISLLTGASLANYSGAITPARCSKEVMHSLHKIRQACIKAKHYLYFTISTAGLKYSKELFWLFGGFMSVISLTKPYKVSTSSTNINTTCYENKYNASNIKVRVKHQ